MNSDSTKTTGMKAVVLNAYRRSNSGDGLLVDETVGLLNEAFPGISITLVSMEPSSFPEYGPGLHPIAGTHEKMLPASLLARLLTARPHPAVTAAIEGADVAVAVGGGYIRADHPSAAAKSFLSHMVQAPSRSTRTPYVYLPQSIGPLPPRFIPFGAARLSRARAVFVRDDRSHAELSARGIATVRMPDLAAISIGTSPLTPKPSGLSTRTALIARSLSGGEAGYRSRLTALMEILGPEILVQSSGAGNDDRAFYRTQGWGSSHRKTLDALLSEQHPVVVTSVRLHGALQSILAGIPAVHLSYERKGWGAYEDLGIAQYVHNARSFDPALVANQVRDLTVDASAYWEAIFDRRPALARARDEILATLRSSVR